MQFIIVRFLTLFNIGLKPKVSLLVLEIKFEIIYDLAIARYNKK